MAGKGIREKEPDDVGYTCSGRSGVGGACVI